MNDQNNVVLTVAILLSLVTVRVAAEEPVQSGPPDGAVVSSAAPDSPGDTAHRSTRVFRNPETGVIEFAPAASTPLTGLSVREQNMLSRSDQGLQARVLANGAVALDLQGRFQSMATAAADSDTGQLKMSCSIDDGVHPHDTVESEHAE